MKRTLVGGAVAALLLVGAAVAVADDFDGGKNVTAVSATFGANTPSRVTTRTCTMSNGQTIVVTDATFTGTSSGPIELTGNATVRARSTINTTTNVGVVSATLKIDVASGRDTAAQFTGVYSSGQVAGLAVGHAGTGRLVANVSGAFGASTGFGPGSKIGGGTGAGAAVELTPAGCNKVKTVANKSEARGTVTANGNGTIIVAGLQCTVPPSLQAKVATIALNSRAEIHCRLVNGVNTLTSVEKKGD
jgi:hypothetical protein